MHKYNRMSRIAGVLLALIFIWAGTSAAIEIRPNIEIDLPVVPAEEDGTVYLVVQFDIPKKPVDVTRVRPDLSLGMVIDRSGSMEDRRKMEYAKRAAQMVVDRMRTSDRLGVVEYDDQITVLWPSSPVTSPGAIKDKIASLRPRNSTNLVAGMMKGVDQVHGSMFPHGINRVMLLSDGLANTGVTNPNTIKSMVREARRKGVTISTMGLGLDYDEDLMQMIAEHGGGRYYFIENPNQMRDIFQQELGTLFATAARDVRAIFRSSGITRDVHVFGYPCEKDASGLSIDLGSLYAGEKLSMVIRLNIEPGSEGVAQLGTLEFNYTDVEENTPRQFVQDFDVKVSRDANLVKSSQNKKAAVEATLVEADAFHEQQVRLYEQGNMESAVSNLMALKEELEAKNVDLDDVQLAAKLEAIEMESSEMERAEQDFEYKRYYTVQNKARYYKSQQGNRQLYLQQTGDSGYDVKRVQQVLTDKGFYKGPIDGNYTTEVAEAVKKFQTAENLTADGIAGPKTLKKLGLY